jgi:hypothetical protein
VIALSKDETLQQTLKTNIHSLPSQMQMNHCKGNTETYPVSKLNDIQKIYFIGIGGIGMSALARYFKSKGVDVSGYDKTSTPLTRELEAAVSLFIMRNVLILRQKIRMQLCTRQPYPHSMPNWFITANITIQ